MTATAIKRDLQAMSSRLARAKLDPKTLISSKVAERARAFVEALAGTAMVASKAGFHGLIVTIDEVEVETQGTPEFVATFWKRLRN